MIYYKQASLEVAMIERLLLYFRGITSRAAAAEGSFILCSSGKLSVLSTKEGRKAIEDLRYSCG